MPRLPRLNFPGLIHHVIQRGNNREYIFENEIARNYMLTLFRQAVAEDGAEIFAYVVMNNHYHLAIRSREKPLSKVMHRINTTYGLAYNSHLSRTGHVFQGRFKAVPILDERYLMAVIRYIHQNPVAARICERSEDYRWSSEAYYRQLREDFVDFRLPLAWFSDDSEMARQRYREYMAAADEIDWEDFVCIDNDEVNMKLDQTGPDGQMSSASMAPDSLVESADNPEDERDSSIAFENFEAPPAMSLDEILLKTGAAGREREAILAGSRQRKLVPYKIEFARAAYRQGYNMQQIARYLNVTPTAIYHYLK
ncbi:MAG: transposase [Syntrophomonadaceae bacterium]